MANPFTSINVYPNYQTGHYIEWSIDPLFRDKAPYNFTLEVAETSDFSELIFSQELGEAFNAVDNSGWKRNLTTGYAYRVKLTTGSGTYYSSSVELGTTTAGSLKFRQAAEVMRNELIQHRYAGEYAFFLKRKTYGPVDASAVDPVTGAVWSDNTTSFGTNRGYYNPIPTSWRKLHEQTERKMSQIGNGTDEDYAQDVLMIGYPRVADEDILVQKRTDQRYICRGVHSTNIPGVGIPVLQSVSLYLIPTTDTLYSIPMPV